MSIVIPRKRPGSISVEPAESVTESPPTSTKSGVVGKQIFSVFSFIFALFVASYVYNALGPDEHETPADRSAAKAASPAGEIKQTSTANSFRPQVWEQLRALRDEAIKDIGWVAGNAYGHEIWPQVEPYVGRGGIYYDALLRTKSSPDADPETDAMMNVGLYREWFARGQAVQFSEDEAVSRIKRVLQIQEQMTTLIRGR